jgi:hypothetical protein
VKQGVNEDAGRLWNVRLKDGRTVVVRFFVLEDKEKLAEMFASMSSRALRGECRLTRQRLLTDG